MDSDRSWMWHRRDVEGYIRLEFIEGVEKFLNFAFSQPRFVSNNLIKCPCSKCDNKKFDTRENVNIHLLRDGFTIGYTKWVAHGESMNRLSSYIGESSRDVQNEDSHIRKMVFDVAGPNFDWSPTFSHNSDFENDEQMPNPDAQKFYDLLKDADEPLWEGCKQHTKLSAMAQLLNIKSDFNLPEACYDRLMTTIKSMMPEGEKLPSNFHQTKKHLAKLGLRYVKIDACMNSCMLYYKENELLTECKICHHPRYKLSNLRSRKKVPYKVLHYLPLTPRLQKLYMAGETAKEMTWHWDNRYTKDKSIAHPAQAEAWKHFDHTHPTFALEPRNVRLGLCTDGFCPFGKFSNPYTCWPVIITVYNLPPGLCMEDQYMFLNMVVPGPKSPGKNLDIFLCPLIDELKELWEVGVQTFDAFTKQNFQMRAALLWTVSDFPANAILSGWSTHGVLACPYCMECTKAFYLNHGGKPCWFDCHRQFLPLDHPFRKQKDKFRVNRIEIDKPPPRLSGQEMKMRVDQLPKITFGTQSRSQKIPGCGTSHNWKKKSIFWELPYWHTNLIRHNLDVMHIEKNVFENIFNTVMDVKGKTKDNANARKDLELHCKRSELHLFSDANGKLWKPKASYTLSKEQIKEVCSWVKKLKLPDDYASNISRCVNENECKFFGMKSHDCHVFMQRLLPIVFRDLLPKPIWEALSELSVFFRGICSTVLHVQHVEKLEKDIVETLCKLEKIFPPSFFDSMEHLPVHLAYEAKVGGPVQYRWMYPFERFLHRLKKKVKNQARPESSIVKAYIIEEISTFCSLYFEKNIETRLNRVPRNDDGGFVDNMGRLSIFTCPGRPLGSQNVGRWLQEDELNVAHRYILLNCEELLSFQEVFYQQKREQYPTITDDQLVLLRDKEFTMWFKHFVKDPSNAIEDRIKEIAQGPNRWVMCYDGYFVNGFKFHTIGYGQFRTSMNSGVRVLGSTWNDDEMDYYGMLIEVLELEYRGIGNKVVLFKCDWYDTTGRWIKNYPKFGLTEINHKKKLQTDDVFILAQQAHQVYYSSFPSLSKDRRDWYAVCKIKARSRIDLPLVDEEKEDVSTRTEGAFQEGEIFVSHHDAFRANTEQTNILVDDSSAPTEVDLEEIRSVLHDIVVDVGEAEEAEEGFEDFDTDDGEGIDDVENNDFLSDDNMNCDD